MKKFFTKLFTLGAMLSSCLSSFAYDIEVDGIYYNILSLADFTCEVTKGDIGYSGDIVIPAQIQYNNSIFDVVGIGYNAFVNCPLKSIEIPNSITTIGDMVFYCCKFLQSIAIPNSVTTIGDAAFINCLSLESIEIPNSVTTIGSAAFCGCASLESIAIPNSVTTIGDAVFYFCI